ncbi:MAG: exodeoxyribonuclease VII small subunit [Ruminococcus sp.]|nr:exodeoxyribonuclease VII small subunit [Ruminococcus sp.]MBQ8906797.1 exodeoxyribonuclease VII small subunit [Ruminococcus sp.]
MTFEDGMKRLTEIVTALEQGELSLSESVALYEEGLKVSKDCRRTLDDARLKVVGEQGEEIAI